MRRQGSILLAVEVDKDWNENTLLGLADVKAVAKAWVIVDDCEEFGKTLERFQWAKGTLGEFLCNYGGLEPGELLFAFKGVNLLYNARLP